MQNVKQDIGIRLYPQDCNGSYKFNGRVVMTEGFIHEFGEAIAPHLAIMAVKKIWTERVNSKGG